MIGCVYGAGDISHGIASPNWPTVKGRITRTDQVVMSRDRKSQKTTTVVSYGYQLDDRPYVSRTIWSGVGFGNDAVLKRYTDGMEVTVYYNPDNPAVAVLQPGLKLPHSCTVAGLGALGLLIGVACLTATWIRLRRFEAIKKNAQPGVHQTWREAGAVTAGAR